MAKINWRGLVDSASAVLQKHSPEILTGLGIAGMITTTVLAVKATPEACRRIEERKEKEHHKKLTLIQTVETAGACYIPAAVTGVMSIGCLLGANTVHERRNTALAVAYNLSENAVREYDEYRRKTAEEIGEEKEREIYREIKQDHADRDETMRDCAPQVLVNGRKYGLVKNESMGGFFYGDENVIRTGVSRANQKLARNDYISLDELYSELEDAGAVGIDNCMNIGSKVGWNHQKGLIDVRVDSVVRDGQPILTMSIYPLPYYDYDIYG